MSTSPASRTPTVARSFLLRRVLFAIWAVGFVPLFAALRSYLHVAPLSRSLIGTGVFCVSAVAALWFLGREKHPTLRAWRIVFVLWTLLLTPLLLTISDGIAEQGWPSGRMNRPIAHLLRLVLTLAIPSFLTGLGALIRTYRVAGVLAVVTGLISLVTSVFLFRATAPIRISPLRLVDILDIVGFCSKATTYLSIPVGIALIVGGIMTFQAARAGTVSATSSP